MNPKTYFIGMLVTEPDGAQRELPPLPMPAENLALAVRDYIQEQSARLVAEGLPLPQFAEYTLLGEAA